MHILRINTTYQPKIVINSPEVYLGITIQHAQVGHKNINIFSYKNHLGRIYINGKQFIINDLHHNFVQFLAQELFIT
jgi:gamma-glutamyl-gamma-aminobutyrate hydrolase PuuD